MKQLDQIRNFCIIAHIDHGKSTLADRFLELTGTVAKREMQDQLLDSMEIERERGITVKLAPVRMQWRGIELNLIDTPGHVDFQYEVSRSLAAVEGAILVVDATQGIQAQTLANLDLARAQGLTIIPVVNKIDLPNADTDQVVADLVKLLDVKVEAIIRASAKVGTGVTAILDRVVRDVPPPTGQVEAPLRALIFDSTFDPFQGVIVFVRIIDGQTQANQNIFFLATQATSITLDVGTFTPKRKTSPVLQAGEIGYIVTGLKDVADARVGDTVTLNPPTVKPLAGYRQLPPMVYAGLFTQAGDEYPKLRTAMEKLRLNDASLTYEPEQSPALGYGFRCGFLGLLHLDIIRERLEREYGMKVLVTVPSVGYHVFRKNTPAPLVVRSPLQLPDMSTVDRIEEPLMKLNVVIPARTIGAVMQATQERRGLFLSLDYIDADRALLHFTIPLASILVDYYDILKSVTSGYASLNYELNGYAVADVVRMDIVVAGEVVEHLATIIYRPAAQRAGRQVVESLKEILPRQQFEVKIQAAIGGQIIASEHLPARRKDVTAGLYGGDVTRKRKVLEKQKKGKARMKTMGKVDIPPAAYLAVLKH